MRSVRSDVHGIKASERTNRARMLRDSDQASPDYIFASVDARAKLRDGPTGDGDWLPREDDVGRHVGAQR